MGNGEEDARRGEGDGGKETNEKANKREENGRSASNKRASFVSTIRQRRGAGRRRRGGRKTRRGRG